jgi:hypothetical protein
MKTSDFATWSGVLRFQDIAGVVDCPSNTVQNQQCVNSYEGRPSVWCCLREQLGITDTSVDCTGLNSCGVAGDNPASVTPDAAAVSADAAASNPPAVTKKGCCNAGGSGPGSAALAFCVGLALWQRRRR